MSQPLLCCLTLWCQVKEISTNTKINVEKSWKHHIFLSLIGALGFVLEFFGSYLALSPRLSKYSQMERFLNIIIVGSVPTGFNMMMSIPSWLLLSSMTQYMEVELISVSKSSSKAKVREVIKLFYQYQRALNHPALMNLAIW